MSAANSKLSRAEKVGYAVGDVGTNFLFMSMILYQGRFYTDTMGLTASAAGWMFIAVRGFDAIFDPVVGALSDRTKSRWGKFRPWVLFTAVPMGFVFWISFRTPHFGSEGKLIYAYVTYVVLMMLYSANNTPYSALNGVMTGDAGERTSIATYRFVAAMIGQFAIQALALPLVDKFGQGDTAKGWSATMAIFGSLMVVCYLATFATTRERVLPDVRQKSSVREDLKDVLSCRPWILMFLLTLLVFTSLSLRGSATNYYFTYYVSKPDLGRFLGSLGLGATGDAGSVMRRVLGAFGLLVKTDGSNTTDVGLSFILVAGNILQVPGILVSKRLSERFGKKAVFIAGMSLSTLATALIFLIPASSVGLLFWISMLWPLGWGPTVPLLWVMIADVADFSEWKNFRRATGFVYAGIIFALKAGLGLGGFIGGLLLDWYGYVPNAVQTEHALLGIRLLATLFSAIPFVLGLVCLVLYPIGKDLNLRLQSDLADRRKSQPAPA